jgi:hypothetical protein
MGKFLAPVTWPENVTLSMWIKNSFSYSCRVTFFFLLGNLSPNGAFFFSCLQEVLLRADQEFSQRIAQQSAFQNAFFQMVTSGQGILNPFLEIQVARTNLVQDTINQALGFF